MAATTLETIPGPHTTISFDIFSDPHTGSIFPAHIGSHHISWTYELVAKTHGQNA